MRSSDIKRKLEHKWNYCLLCCGQHNACRFKNVSQNRPSVHIEEGFSQRTSIKVDNLSGVGSGNVSMQKISSKNVSKPVHTDFYELKQLFQLNR